MKLRIDLADDCSHSICDCIKDAIEGKIMPAVYDEGYYDGASSIIESLPSIMSSAAEAVKKGISSQEWLAAMTRTLLAAVASPESKGVNVSRVEVKEAVN